MDYRKKLTKFLAKGYLHGDSYLVTIKDLEKKQCLPYSWGRMNKRPNGSLLPPQIKPKKVLSWNEAMESRPPLKLDMDGPGPTSYSPFGTTSKEINAPAYTFGRKSPTKEGGGRTAWQTPWFQSSTPFTRKTSFETKWPSPVHYLQPSTLGPRQPSRPQDPSYSFGRKRRQGFPSKDILNESPPDKYDEGLDARNMIVSPLTYILQDRVDGICPWLNKGSL
ncbi:protein STPG3 isoform X2 [Rhinatrema bivittatum]|uniref:protein STPG3 isoform X2 n=1 Tax=Rhinatrema bivittatum TaxID=194408 RepID=UPI0011275260|nr:protein STPG3 isoform X2 [Rhinatrema bivittatum]